MSRQLVASQRPPRERSASTDETLKLQARDRDVRHGAAETFSGPRATEKQCTAAAGWGTAPLSDQSAACLAGERNNLVLCKRSTRADHKHSTWPRGTSAGKGQSATKKHRLALRQAHSATRSCSVLLRLSVNDDRVQANAETNEKLPARNSGEIRGGAGHHNSQHARKSRDSVRGQRARGGRLCA